jgi:tetratricopeptide (TPR) repeat protein
MKLSRMLLVAALAAFGWLGSRTAQAVDDPVEFLHALQDGGYPDIAVEYLKAIKDKPDAPKEIIALWDLEMSRSLRASASMAYNEEEAKRITDEAQRYLEKFIKDNPDHPEAVKEDARWADMQGEEALREMQRSRGLTDAAKKAEALDKAHKLLELVRPRFVKALAKFKARLAAMPRPEVRGKPTPPQKKQLEAIAAAEEQVIETELKVALADFYLALTIADSNSPKRKEALESVGKTFNLMFQKHRGTPWGLRAHFLEARTMHELGDLSTAMDIYDEVMVTAPEVDAVPERGKPGSRKVALSGFEGVFSEVEQHRLQILIDPRNPKRSLKDYNTEARLWQEPRYEPYYLKTDGYQGILFDYVKFLQAQSEKATEANKGKFKTDMARILKKMAKVPSQYQQEAIRILRSQGGSTEEGPDELLTEAGELATAKKWPEALKKYEQALDAQMKVKVKPAEKGKLLDEIRNAIAGCHCNIALSHFKKGALTEATDTLRMVLKEYRDTENGPVAAELLLTVVTNQYATTLEGDEKSDPDIKDKQAAALKKLIATAQGIIDVWPGRPVADSARLALGRIEVYGERMDKAMEIFRAINPKSPHYSTALYLVGYTYWRKYTLAKRQVEEKKEQGLKPDAGDEKNLADLRPRAVKPIERAVQVLAELPPEKDGRMLKQLVDAQLLLAEMKLEGGEPKESAALFQPLIEEAQKSAGKTLDPTMLRVFNGAVKAYLQANEMEKAGKVGEVLVKLGPDVPFINLSLVDFAKRLDKERKSVEVELEKPGRHEGLKEKLASYQKMLRDVLTNLMAREKVSLAGMIWSAKTSIAIGMFDEAEAQLQKVLGVMENDQDPAIKKAVPGVRVLLLSVLRKKGKLDEALEQVEMLMKESRSLEPKMEKGRILQAIAEKEPEKFQAAVNHWDYLRRGLEQLPEQKRPKRAEFDATLFEVVNGEAQCFYDWAKKTGDKEHAKTGEQIVRQFLMRNITGLSSESKNRLLAQADKLCVLQGKTPPAPAEKKKPDATKKTGAAKKS